MGDRGVALSVLWAALLGASLGLDRNMRDLSAGWAPCAFWAALGAVLGIELQLSGLANSVWFWPLTCATCAVAIAKYLTLTVTIGGWRRPTEPAHALVAAFAFGMACGVGASRFVGVAIIATIFALAWRPRIDDSLRRAVAQDSDVALRISREIVDVGRRAEEGRHDDEGRQQSEEQRNGEQLAHSGRAGVRGQA